MQKLNVGDRVKFVSEGKPYKVCASDNRFAICIKPFNLRKTTIYTIVDFERGVRGPDNMVFGGGYESKEDAEEALVKLQDGDIEVSYRNCIDLDIEKVVTPVWTKKDIKQIEQEANDLATLLNEQ
jgi:hypothetical protein